MAMPILASKLFLPPPRPGLVPRPRLIGRLNDGLSKGCRLTLISASAGFGKTTLVSEWIAQCGRPLAWLSLDKGDNDWVRFITYFVAALQKVEPKIGAGLLEALQSPQPPPSELILTALINEIGAIPVNFILVLDDFHTIDAQSINDALAFLIEHLPPQLHLVLATREDPDLPLARLRSRGQLAELRTADLRFTSLEASEFLKSTMGLNLSDRDVEALESRTEGWIAGLQLAALSLQGREDSADFIQTFTGSHRFVLDYLVEEVLQRQPKSVREFLLQTSILNRLCASLCNALTGRKDSRQILDVLERSNLFLIPLDNERQWVRYHHLFSDVLQTRFLSEFPGQAASFHIRASEWFEQNGYRLDAIRHSLAAQAFTKASVLIELAMPDLRRSRQGATLLAFLKALPQNLVSFRPVLSAAFAWALLGAGDLQAIEARLQDAERWLDTAAGLPAPLKSRPAEMVVVDEEEFRRLPGLIAIVRAGQALVENDMPKVVKNAQKAYEFALDGDHLTRGGAASQLGLAAWANGDLAAARGMTAEGMKNLRQGGYLSAAVGSAITLADIQIAQGCLTEAKAACEQALQWVMAPDAPYKWGAADMHVGLSTLYFEHNDLQSAEQHLLASQSLGNLAGLPQNPYRWCAAMARIREALGDLNGALELLEQAGRLYDGNFSPNVRPIDARITRVWVKQGRLDEALYWAHERGLSVADELAYMHEFNHITLARVLLACNQGKASNGSFSELEGLLERLLNAATEGGRMGSAIEILILQALACQVQGNLPKALIPLRRALELAEPQGFVRIFLDEGLSMLRLLYEASAHGIMPGYTGRLLAAFDTGKQKSENKPVLPLARPEFEPLSKRELEILRLVAQGLSNRQIGERLFLALDTVKGHNRKIFDKLHVQSRTEAVACARGLGLL